MAHRLFAEHGFDAVTIADIAGQADVAVQTVFNHFATKEELFFDDRADWVDGAAAAVRSRPEGVAPLAALRAHLDGDGALVPAPADRGRPDAGHASRPCEASPSLAPTSGSCTTSPSAG